MKRLLLFLPLVALAVCIVAAPTQRTVKLSWLDYPADGPPGSISNYTFIVHTATNAAIPMPWPPMVSVTGVTSAVIQVTNSIQFFYVTAIDLRSNPTNYLPETDPSGVVSFRLPPSGALTIGAGP